MPTATTTLEILVKLKDEASAAMQGLGSNLQSVGSQMTAVGKTMTADITLPLVAFAAYAVKGAMDFQQAMTLIQTEAGASATEVQDLSDQVMTLAQSSQQGPTELAKGLYHLISLGLDAKDAMVALKAASDGAAVGQADLEQVTNALGGAISSGIKGTSDYTGTMATLNAIVGSGNMRMSDLVGALGTGVLASANTAGLALNDVGAALATMTDNGVPATDAATRLRMTFSLMEAPTKGAISALASIGMTQFQLADDMRNKGLLPALQDLVKHLKDSGKTADEQAAVITKAFGGARTGTTIELLTQNLGKLGDKYKLISQDVNSFGVDVNAQANTWQGQLDNMNANLQVFRDGVGKSLLEIGNEVLPIVIAALKDAVTWWDNLSPGVQKVIIYIALFAAVIGPVLIFVGMVTTAIGVLIPVLVGFGTVLAFLAANPIVLIIAAVALIVIAIYELITHWKQVSAWMQAELKVLSDNWNLMWQNMSNFIGNIWSTIANTVKSGVNNVISAINGMISALDSIHISIPAIQIPGTKIGTPALDLGFNIPHIPMLAAGGIVYNPMLAMIGEDGPEAVVPLSSLGGGGGGFGGGTQITVNINGGIFPADQSTIKQIGDMLAKAITQQLRTRNYAT